MIEEYLMLTLNQLNTAGFLDSRANLGIDITVTFLALLPVLSAISIFFAIRKHLKLHQFTQFLLFFLSLVFLSLFAYLVYYKESFDFLVQTSSVDDTQVFILLVIHIIVVFVTLTLWAFVLLYALSDRKRRALPGVYSVSHAKSGKRVFKGIILMALTSVGIYWVLFML